MEQSAETGVPVVPVVENEQKSGNGLKIATAIACVVAVCGIGFGVYGMIQSSQKDNQINDLERQVGSYQDIKKDNNGIIAEEKSINYYFTNENAPELEDSEGIDVSSWSGIDFRLQSDGSVEASFYRVIWDAYMPEIKEQKRGVFEKDILTDYIDGRVVDIATGLVGNGANEKILFLLNDGTVDYISTDSILLRKYDFKKLSGVNDIVRIYGNLHEIDRAGYIQLSSGKILPILDDTENNTLYVE